MMETYLFYFFFGNLFFELLPLWVQGMVLLVTYQQLHLLKIYGVLG